MSSVIKHHTLKSVSNSDLRRISKVMEGFVFIHDKLFTIPANVCICTHSKKRVDILWFYFRQKNNNGAIYLAVKIHPEVLKRT